MSKRRTVSELIEYHKKLTLGHNTFSVMALAFLIILILMLLMTEKQSDILVLTMGITVLVNATISYFVKKYADRIYGRINQGGSLTKP